MRPKAVLFDCDGVLVDSEPRTHALLARRLSDAGFSVEPAEVSGMFLGGTIKGLAKHARSLGASLHDDWVEETYEALYVELAGTEEIPGAVDLVTDLDAAGIPLAVCSNGPLRKMEVTLGGIGLLNRLEGRIFSAHVHAKPKPAPDLYLLGARSLGVAPETCLVVEDSANGACAAQAAGIPCMALTTLESAASLQEAGAQPISSLEEIREAVLG